MHDVLHGVHTGDHLGVEDGFGEYLGIGLECGGGAGAGGGADLLELRVYFAALVFLAIHVAVEPHLHFAPFAERIDDRRAHAVQAARYLVRVV